MKALVTGSHGFIGNHLVLKLALLGWEVFRGDRFGTVPKGVDYIFDNAASGNLYGQIDLNTIITANIVRVSKLLDNAKKRKVKKVILT